MIDLDSPTARQELEKRLSTSLGKLKALDRDLLAAPMSEKALTFRLGYYLQQEFAHYQVDCDYQPGSRAAEALQGIRLPRAAHDPWSLEDVSVFPDILVHQRKSPAHKLLLLEVRRKNCHVRRKHWEFQKLKAYQQALGCRFAVLVELDDQGAKLQFV